MKKIRVYKLAKKKKLKSREVIELLGKKGFKNLKATSSVDPNILDDAPPKTGVKTDAKIGAKGTVSHIFGDQKKEPSAATPLRPVTSLAEKIQAPPPAVMKKETAKKESPKTGEDKVKKTVAPKAPAAQTKKTSGGGLSLAALGLSLAVLVVLGFLYTGMQADRTQLNSINTTLGTLNAKISVMDESLVTSRAQVMDMREQIAAVNGQLSNQMEAVDGKLSDMNQRITASGQAALTAQLKTQGPVITALAKELDGPLKARVTGLADGISAF